MNDTPASDEIDLTELFSTLWNAKWLIFFGDSGRSICHSGLALSLRFAKK